MTTHWLLSTTLMLGLSVVNASAQAPAAGAKPREVRLLVGDQFVLEPGFAVGDIAVGDPAIADFRMRPGRQAVCCWHRRGPHQVIMWDQSNKPAPKWNSSRNARSAGRSKSTDPLLIFLRCLDGSAPTWFVGQYHPRDDLAPSGGWLLDGRRILRAIRAARVPLGGGRPERRGSRIRAAAVSRPAYRRHRIRRSVMEASIAFGSSA